MIDKVASKVVNKHLSTAEKIIGYQFIDKDLLQRALTHPSAVEKEKYDNSYERLEFLGDSILGSIVANALYRDFPAMNEGDMTRLKVQLVAGSSLSVVAEELGLGKCIFFGSSERGTGKRGMASALENVYEALVAAISLDGGYQAACDFVENSLLVRVNDELLGDIESPKSRLQEILQARRAMPAYELIDTKGPPHNRTFTCKVSVNGSCIGTGSGKTKKDAEAQAARAALAAL